MSKKNDSWGIEVGANALKAVRLVREGNEVDVAAYDVIPFKKVLTTPDLNVDEAIQVNLDQFLTRHDISKSAVVVSVPGNMAFARFAKLPPVEPKKIPDIVRFEAQQQIPFPIDQVEWDYQVFAQDDSPDVEVGIFAIAKERVGQFLSNYNRLNIKIDALTLSPLAVVNAMAYDMDLLKGGKGTIILDIGTTSTDLIVVEGGRVWMRTMAIGGNNFTEALVKAFKLSFPKAEKLKREAGTSKYARQIFQAMRPVFADLVQDIQRSLGFYQTANRDAELDQLIGVGSTFRLPGLQKFLKQQLQIEIIRPDGFKRIKVDGKQAADFSENALNLTTAYGLALQGLGMEQVSANVLPEHVIKSRLWKAKQPWIGAAAAIILVAVGGAWFKVATEKGSYANAKQETDKTVAPLIAEAQKYKNELDTMVKATDPRTRINNLQRILDYRDVWPKLIEDLSLATASLGAQRELGEPDYELHARIPRGQRKRVFIETFDAQYVESRTAVAGAPVTPGQPRRASQAYSFEQPAPPPTTPAADGTTPVDPNAPVRTRPSIIITITGTTPYANNPGPFLSNTLVRFLKDLPAQGRPYKVISAKLDTLQAVTAPTTDGVTPATPFRGRRPAAVEEPTRIRRPAQPVAPVRPDPAQPGAEGEDALDDSLFPNRPLLDEPTEGDHRFTIIWTVELLSPDEARRLEDAAKETPAQVRPSAQAQPESSPVAAKE